MYAMTHKCVRYGLFGQVAANCNVNSVVPLPSSLIPGGRRNKTRRYRSRTVGSRRISKRFRRRR